MDMEKRIISMIVKWVAERKMISFLQKTQEQANRNQAKRSKLKPC